HSMLFEADVKPAFLPRNLPADPNSIQAGLVQIYRQRVTSVSTCIEESFCKVGTRIQPRLMSFSHGLARTGHATWRCVLLS
ncbi:MAG: hypothetical protein K6T68_15415, partial [Alicyclobacillus shizuokensis]|nr:hypothetical protein [Alicyclobacillus shizuokensis]